jgi:hypothetical protein
MFRALLSNKLRCLLTSQSIQVIRHSAQFELLSFGHYQSAKEITLYLHGSGGFEKGTTGQFEFEGFPSLLLKGAISWSTPFVVVCAMSGSHYNLTDLTELIEDLYRETKISKIHCVAYSRGGLGIVEHFSRTDLFASITLINCKPPNLIPTTLDSPVHVIYSAEDDRVLAKDVVNSFKPITSKITITRWEGDHYAISNIARSGIDGNAISKLTD